MSLIKQLAGETFIYGLSSILSRLLHYFILVPFFTRIFLTGEYGVISNMYTWAALLTVLFTYRMETAFFRFGSEEGQLNKAFSTAAISLLLSTIIYVALFVSFSESLAGWLNYPEHPEYIVWFTFIIAFDALAAIPFAQLRLQNRPIKFAIVKLLNIVINIIFVLFFLWACPYLLENGHDWVRSFYNPEQKITYVFIANFIASGGVILLLLPSYLKIKLRFDWDLWKKMLIYALPLIIAGLAAVINQLIGIPLLIELLPGTVDENHEQAGIYGAVAKLAVLMNLFTQAFNYAAEPFFFKNASRKDSKEVYAQVGQVFAIVGSIVFLGIVLYIDIIKLFIGKDFRQGLGIVPLLLIGYFFLGLFYNFSAWYKLTDRTKIGGLIATVGAIITLLLNFLLIPNPSFGYYGPAWSAMICYTFMAMATYWTGQKYYPIPYPIVRIIGYLVLAIGIYGISLAVAPMINNHLVISLLANTGLLLLFLLILFFWERRLIKSLFKI